MGSHKRLKSGTVTEGNTNGVSEKQDSEGVEMTPSPNVDESNPESPTSKDEKRLKRLLKVMKEHKKSRNSGERKEHHQKLFKTPKETVESFAIAAQKKALWPIDKLMILGFLAGVYVAFGGGFALIVSQGITADAGIKKLLLGGTFPVAFYLIVFLGGELFTGNTNTMMIGLFSKTVNLKQALFNLVVVYLANFAGCTFAAYFFYYLPEIFGTDPWLSGIKALTYSKVLGHDWGVTFLRAIPANWLVCAAFFIVTSAEDVAGKVIGSWFPIATFAATGFEHCIANMFFLPLGLMYGANYNFGEYIYASLIPTTLGNLVGGALFVGALQWYVYSFSGRTYFKNPQSLPVKNPDEVTVCRLGFLDP